MKTQIDLLCLVDDDPIFQFGVKKLVDYTQCSKSILVFNNGQEAIDHLKVYLSNAEKIPSVILLDINMPIMDGWEFLEAFSVIKNKLAKVILIYMVSSSVNQDDIDRAKSISEVSDYIIKPITVEHLNKMLLELSE